MRWSTPFALAALLAGCGAGGSTSAVPQTTLQSHASSGGGAVGQQIAAGAFIPACTDIVSGRFHCLALGLRDSSRAPISEMPAAAR